MENNTDTLENQKIHKELQKKFVHPRWYKTRENGKWISYKTRAEALDEMAETGDFYLSKKRVIDKKINEYRDIDILAYAGREGGIYRISQIEKDYFIERADYWAQKKRKRIKETMKIK